MKKSDKLPLSRELMAQEHDADIAKLLKAESALRRCSASTLAEWDGEEFLNKCQTASLLRYWGFSEVFALHCLRLGGKSGRVTLLIHEPPLGYLVTISGTFNESGDLEELAGRIDKGEPYHLDLDNWNDDIGHTLEPRLNDQDWVKSQWIEILSYESERKTQSETTPSGGLVSVIRFRHSRSQAYRKFSEEKWYDLFIPADWRLTCPLDRLAYKSFESRADSVVERFEAVVSRFGAIDRE